MRPLTTKHWFRHRIVAAWPMPSQYLNQSRDIVNRALRNKLKWNVNRNSYIFLQGNAFKNVIWVMATILSRPQGVKLKHFPRSNNTSSPREGGNWHSKPPIRTKSTLYSSEILRIGSFRNVYGIQHIESETKWLSFSRCQFSYLLVWKPLYFVFSIWPNLSVFQVMALCRTGDKLTFKSMVTMIGEAYMPQ